MISRWFSVALFFSFLFHSAPVQAWTEGALKVADPFVFTPNDLDLRSFKIEGPVLWEWVEGSFEWVRLDAKFEIPRAKVRLTVPATAKVTYQKQVFLPAPDGKVVIPVVLTQERSKGNRNEILIEDFVTRQMSRAVIAYKAQPMEQPIVFDPNCSPLRIQLSEVKLTHSWVYVFCQVIHPQTTGGSGMKVDLELYWEMEGSPEIVRVNTKPIALDDGLTAAVGVEASTPRLSFQRGSGDQMDSFDLDVRVSERFHPLGVSLGLGPYSHQNVVRLFPTVYASYFFNEKLKLGMFGAFPVRQSPEVDVGLYLITEQFRGVDERILLNLLLGFHTLSYVPEGKRVFASSAPQGIEVIFRDLFFKRQNFTIGSFFYPEINRRYYVNAWVRYGGPIFAEINFIHWQEPVNSVTTFGAKSFGLSIGFPLFRAL